MDTDQWPRTRLELSATVLGTVAVLVLVRELVGFAVGNTTGWNSWVGLVSGLLGGTAMVAILELLVEVDADELATFRRIQYVHVVYGVVAGGLYPAVGSTIGVGSEWTTTVPWVLVGGLAYTVALFGLAMVVYVSVGAVQFDRKGLQEITALFGLYLVFAVVFGVSMALRVPVWYRLFGF